MLGLGLGRCDFGVAFGLRHVVRHVLDGDRPGFGRSWRWRLRRPRVVVDLESKLFVVLQHLPLQPFNLLRVLLAPFVTIPRCLAPERFPARDTLPLFRVLSIRGCPVQSVVRGGGTRLLPLLLDIHRGRALTRLGGVRPRALLGHAQLCLMSEVAFVPGVAFPDEERERLVSAISGWDDRWKRVDLPGRCRCTPSWRHHAPSCSLSPLVWISIVAVHMFTPHIIQEGDKPSNPPVGRIYGIVPVHPDEVLHG